MTSTQRIVSFTERRRRMTKDEARLEFFEAVAKVALKIRVRERNLIEATGDAYAHAAVDAALADTLGMLEEMAKLGNDPVFKGLQVNYCPNADTFTYFNHRPRSIAFQRDRDISRAEAEALLGDSPHG